jgi:CO/xanthine dehydrogenase FAD-binding subunit
VGAYAQVRQAVPSPTHATPFVGRFQIRNHGTLGGSIGTLDAAGEYPAVALALDAVIEALSPRGRREIAAADFFTGLWETAMEPDEVLTGVRFPVWNGRSGFAVHEFSRRHGDFAIAGALAAVQLDDHDRVSRCAIGLLGLGSTPRRATAAEVSIIGKPLNELAAADIDQAAMTGLDEPTGVRVVPHPGGRRHGRARLDPSRPGSSRQGKRCVNNRSSCRSTELLSRAASNRA